MADGLRVVAGAFDPVGEVVDLLFVFLLGFGVRALLAGKGREIESARLDSGPVDDHGDAALDLHVVHAPPGEAEGGGLAADDAAATAGIEAATGRNGEDFGDAGGAGDRNMFARGGDG